MRINKIVIGPVISYFKNKNIWLYVIDVELEIMFQTS